VSPVIGVILMVAITVILAAVIATFVLGLGEQISDTGPTASFDFEYNEDPNGDELTITHTSGNTIAAENLFIRGSDSDDGNWVGRDAGDSTTYGQGSQIRSGSSVTVDVESDDTVRVVWESSSGGQSKTLEDWRGPDA
jgi:flagellin-like protein